MNYYVDALAQRGTDGFCCSCSYVSQIILYEDGAAEECGIGGNPVELRGDLFQEEQPTS